MTPEDFTNASSAPSFKEAAVCATIGLTDEERAFLRAIQNPEKRASVISILMKEYRACG